jgi:hypothetical protein
MVDALVALLDGGYVEIRSGLPPDPDDAATGTLLATITLNSPAFGGAVNGVATADVTPQPEDVGVDTGTAGYYRAYASDDTPVIDGSDDMSISNPSITPGTPVRILAWTITMPDGS